MRNTSVESSHTCGSSTSAGWENIADAYILDELWVEVDGRVNGLENSGKHFLWMGILKTTLTSLGSDTLSVLWVFSSGVWELTFVRAVRRAETMTTSSSC